MSIEQQLLAPPLRSGLQSRVPASVANPFPPKMTRSIRDLAGRTAVWKQPSQLRPDYEMMVGEEVVATLRWKKNVGTTAIARSPDGTWSLKASGFLNPRVSIRLPNSEYDLATLRVRNTGDGCLEALGGQRFHWRCVNFWNNVWAFHNAEGDRLFSLKPEGVFPKITGAVDFELASANYQETGYLVGLGWYLLVLMAEDAISGNGPVA